MRRPQPLLAVALALGFAALVAAAPPAPVAYPEGYRSWTHTKSMLIEEGHALYAPFGGIHHVYANAAALGALQKGGAFPDGAVLVFDLLEARRAEGAVTEGSRKVVGVMEKDARRFAATGGWGFEGFKGDTRERVVTNPAEQCFACHDAQRSSDYVYGAWRP